MHPSPEPRISLIIVQIHVDQDHVLTPELGPVTRTLRYVIFNYSIFSSITKNSTTGARPLLSGSNLAYYSSYCSHDILSLRPGVPHSIFFIKHCYCLQAYQDYRQPSRFGDKTYSSRFGDKTYSSRPQGRRY